LQQGRYNAFSMGRKFVSADLDLSSVTLRDQTRHPRELGANPFSGSRDISYRNIKQKQKVTDSAKTESYTQFTACGKQRQLKWQQKISSIGNQHI